jgi:hypothetical protein
MFLVGRMLGNIGGMGRGANLQGITACLIPSLMIGTERPYLSPGHR